MTALGIDIGTSSARVAIFRAEEPELVQFPDGAHSAPAVVAMDGDRVRVGRVALGRAATHPENTVRGIKRLLGRDLDDPVVQRLQSCAAYEIRADGEGRLSLLLGGMPREPEDVAAALLRHLCEVAAQNTGEQASQAVLTTPYWYGPKQRKALRAAAERAGLATLQVLSEANATALSLLTAERSDRLVAIVDVGAGGCTASVLELGPQRVQLVGTAGDPLGGGADVDRGLVRAVVKGLKEKLGDFQGNPAVDEMLLQVCEGAKKDLPTMASVTAVIPFLPVGTGLYNQQLAIDRESFATLMTDTTRRVSEACRQALREAQLDKSSLSGVYATGGMTRLPSLRACIEAALGPIASRRLDPDGAVALGAAYQAGMLAGLVPRIPVLDVQAAVSPPPPTVRPAPSLPPAQVHTAPPPGMPQDTAHRPERVDVHPLPVGLTELAPTRGAGAPSPGEAKKRQVVAQLGEVSGDDIDVEALAAWSAERIAAGAPAAAFESLHALTTGFAGRHDQAAAQALRAQAAAAMFPPEQLALLCDQLKAATAPEPAVVTGVAVVLGLLSDDDFFDQAMGHYQATSNAELQAALLAYLARFARGHEPQIAHLLAHTPADHALRLLERLKELGGPAAVKAVTSAFSSPHSEVRIAALGFLTVLPRQQGEVVLAMVLDDAETKVRVKALETIAEHRLELAVPALVQRVGSDSFHRLPLPERRLLLHTTAQLAPHKAEQLAVAMLTKHQLFRSDALERSRAMAADFLGRSQSNVAFKALDKASRSRVYSSMDLRQAAKRSADAVLQRRSLRPPTGNDPE